MCFFEELYFKLCLKVHVTKFDTWDVKELVLTVDRCQVTYIEVSLSFTNTKFGALLICKQKVQLFCI